VSLDISYTVTKDLQDLLELTPQKDVLFIIGDWNAKVGSQENALVIANTLFQQHKRRLYTWTSPDRWSTIKRVTS